MEDRWYKIHPITISALLSLGILMACLSLVGLSSAASELLSSSPDGWSITFKVLLSGFFGLAAYSISTCAFRGAIPVSLIDGSWFEKGRVGFSFRSFCSLLFHFYLAFAALLASRDIDVDTGATLCLLTYLLIGSKAEASAPKIFRRLESVYLWSKSLSNTGALMLLFCFTLLDKEAFLLVAFFTLPTFVLAGILRWAVDTVIDIDLKKQRIRRLCGILRFVESQKVHEITAPLGYGR